MTVLKFKLKDQRLIKDGSLPFVAAGDVDTDLIAITLDDFWLDFSSYFLTIWGDSDEEPYKVTMQKNGETLSAVVPSEILANPQTVRVAIFAESENGKRKTSSPTLFRVNAGSPVDGLTPIDWNAFKSELISAINDKFDTEFAEDISNDELISAIGELVDGKTAREWFIDEYNRQITEQVRSYERLEYFLSLLSDSMTDEQIIASFTQTFRDTADTARNYLSVQDIIAYIITAYNLDYEFTLDDPTADYTSQANAIKNFLATVVNEKHEAIASIVSALNSHFETTIPTVSTTSEVTTAIAQIPSYGEGYTAAKAEDAPSVNEFQNIINIYENMTPFPVILANGNGFTELYSVEYINTQKMTQDGSRCEISNKIQKCGFDLSSAPSNWLSSTHGSIDTPFQRASELTDLKLTGLETQNKYYKTFYNCQKLKNIELYNFNKNHNVTTVELILGRGYLLENVNCVNGICTEELDFTGIPNLNRAFENCEALKNIRFKKNTIQANISFTQSLLLTKDSVLSIVNGLDVNSTATLTANTLIKTSMRDTWFAKYDETNDVYVECESTDPDAFSFANIVALKGWTLA